MVVRIGDFRVGCSFSGDAARYNENIKRLTSADGELEVSGLNPPTVVIPLRRLDQVGRKALRFALTITPEIHVVQILAEEMDTEDLERRWNSIVERPLERMQYPIPQLHILHSSYREFYRKFLDWLQKFSAQHNGRPVIVLIPELVHRRWYQFIINHRVTRLKAMLLLQGNGSISVMSTPWYPSSKTRRKTEEPAVAIN